jgi:hypothetical protein
VTVHISVEQLVESIVREVVAELTKRGVEISFPGVRVGETPGTHERTGTSLEIDMSAFRTPVLTENQVNRIDAKVSRLIVPCRTVVTPGAWDIIKAKKLTVVRKTQSTR